MASKSFFSSSLQKLLQRPDSYSEGISRPIFVARIFALVLIAMAITVMLGWIFHISVLVQIHPDLVPMQFNTALCFLLSGVSFLTFFSWRHGLAGLSSALLVFISGATLIQYMLGIDFSIDQLFIEHQITTRTSHPGRMSPNSAVCFMLVGLAVLTELMLWEEDYFRLRQYLFGGALLVLSGAAVIGHITQVRTAYGWAYSGMAVHTSIGFFLSGFITLSLSLRKDSVEAFEKRFLVSFLIFVIGFSVIYFSAQFEKKLEIDAYKEQYSLRTEEAARNISERVNNIGEAIQRLLSRWIEHSNSSAVDADFRRYIRDFNEITNLALYSIDVERKQVQQLVEINGSPFNDNTVGVRISVNELLDLAARENYQWVVEGDTALYLGIQTPSDGKVELIVAELPAANLLNAVLEPEIEESFTIRFGPPDTQQPSDDWLDLTFIHPLKFSGWNKALIFEKPSDTLYANSTFWWWIMLSGTLASLALSVGSYFYLLAREGKQNFDLLFNATLTSLICVNYQGKIVRANLEAEHLFGYKPGELAGASVEELVPIDPSTHEQYREAFIQRGKERRMGLGVINGVTKKGDKVPLEVNLAFMAGEKEPLILATIVNISDRQRLADQLQKRSEYFQSLFESLSEGICAINEDGITTYVNTAACQLLGYTQMELMGQSMHSCVQHSHADRRPYHKESSPIRDTLKTGHTHKVEDDVFWSKEDLPIHVEYTSTPIVNNNHSIGAIVAFRPKGSADSAPPQTH